MHVPGPWPSMRERKSCGCCAYYSPFTICFLYSQCKLNGDALRWEYSEMEEALTLERNARRDRERGT